MKGNLILKYFLVLSLLSISQIVCAQTIENTINLQQDESYILKLDDYYDFTASSIDFPKNIPAENIYVPYLEIGNQIEGSNSISSVTSFQDSLSSKYLIAYNVVQNEDKSFNIQILYLHLEIVQGVLTRTQLASFNLLSSIQTAFTITGSFYNSSNGFISYQNNGKQGTVHFSYSQGQGLNPITIDNTIVINNQVAVKGSGNDIYIIYSNRNIIGLLKYQNGGTSLQNVDTFNIDSTVSFNIIVDPTNTLIGYDNMNNLLFCFFIDYGNDKLIINQLTIPKFNNYYSVTSIQRIQNILILALTNINSGSVFIKLNQYENVNGGTISIIEIIETALYIRSNPVFLDQNTLVFYNYDRFLMVNIKKQQLIFQQILDYNHSVDSQQNIGNQFLVYLSKKDDQGKLINLNYAVQLQIPSILITGTNIQLKFTVYQSDKSYNLMIQIAINVTNELITTFTEKEIRLQNMVTSLTNDVYCIPLENYIIGSNFNPEISVSENNLIQNVKLNRVLQLQSSKQIQFNNIQSAYQTDGFISSIITSYQGNSYSIYAAIPLIQGQSGQVSLFTSSFKPQSDIGIIDNYGTFILQSDVGTGQFAIYVPFLINNSLQYNTIITACSQTNFAFASDTQQNVLFFMCDKSIVQFNYQFNNNAEGNLSIVSQKTLLFDASQYQKLICIKGNLFIYNDSYIVSYNYFINSLVGNPLEIPQIAANQKIILFSQSFIIQSENQQKLAVSLYSYGQFQIKKAVLIRNLILDQPYQANLTLIPKRNYLEYLYISTSIENQYSLFRINGAYSQNQLYTTVMIQTDKNSISVISQDLICITGSQQPVQCQQILEQASLCYQQNLSQSIFNSYLTFLSLITLKIGDQQQVYDLYVVRDGSTQYGQVNQNADTIQKLKTEIQDSNFSSGTTLYFNDQQVINSCILGWNAIETSVKIINRFSNVVTQNQQIFTILYNLKAVLQTNQIIIGDNLLKIDGDFSQSCFTILDDSASKIQNNQSSSFTENIYVFCKTIMYKYSLQFTSDQTGAISQVILLDKISQSFDSSIYADQFRRIVSIGTDLWIFNPSSSSKFQIVKKDDSDELTVQLDYIDLTTVQSFNVINSLNLKLSFYKGGLINVQNAKDSKNILYSYHYLQDLLQSANFIVDENDFISAIYQYSDTQFRIQFVNSFIYDITFQLDKNDQLVIASASLFYYRDAFQSFNASISGNQYTLLFGNAIAGLTVVLYNNKSGIQKQYLIQSASTISQQYGAGVTYAEQISQNQFFICFSKGGCTNTSISDNIGVQFLNNKTFFEKNQVIIYPQLLTNQQSWIQLVNPYNPSPSPTSQTRVVFSLGILLFLSLLLV